MSTSLWQGKFNNTHYGRIYTKIIEGSIKNIRKKLPKSNSNYVYYEFHHILPKSIYTSSANLKIHTWNGVLLTAREHFICHVLLMKHYIKIGYKGHSYKMTRAVTAMTLNGKYTSRLYEKLKLNIQHSEITKEKISAAHKGKKLSESHKLNISKCRLGKKLSATHKEKLSVKSKINQIGSGNSSAKKINIYNKFGEIKFECYGNFKEICKLNSLPFEPLRYSITNNTTLYSTQRTKTRAINSGKLEFIGWYAKIV